ncbi:hypothetical protein FRB99_007844 [Tulasnella sp. 403]|nr:hypothetical protein FRB99_007844 [Tulasnella sp. 403]
MTQPTQELPPWLSASTSFITTRGRVFPTTVVVNLPLTYYGPSIPLGSGWVYGGSTSPPPEPTSTVSGQTETLSDTSATSEASVTSEASSSSESSLSATETSSETSSAAVSSESSSATALSSSSVESSSSSTSETSSSSSESSSSTSQSASSSLSLLPSTSTSASSTSSSTTSSSSSTSSTSSSSSTTSLTSTSSLSTSSLLPSTTFPLPSLISTAIPSETSAAVFAHNQGLSRGAIIAISFASVAVALCLVLCCALLLLGRRRRSYIGHDLSVNTGILPPGLGDERGSLLAGRGSGGESPELGPEPGSPEMEDTSHLPIAQIYLGSRRNSSLSAQRGEYHSIGQAPAAGEGEVAVAAEKSPSSRGARTNESGGTVSSHGLFYRPQSAGSPASEMLEEGRVMTAQRGTRLPFFHLGRLSWLARRLSGQQDPPAASRSLAQASGDDEDNWVSVPHATHSVTSPLLPPPAAEPATATTREYVTASERPQVPSPPSSPPPTSYFNVRPSMGARRESGQSAGSLYFDAPSRGQSPDIALRPPTAPSISTKSKEGSVGAPRTADYHSNPGGGPVKFTWPRFGSSIASPVTTREGTREGDLLELPVPLAYARPTTSSMSNPRRESKLSSSLAISTGDEMRRRSAPELSTSSRTVSPTLEEGPPPAFESWKRKLASEKQLPPIPVMEPTELSSRRLTLGPASFVGTPRIVTQPSIASFHGDTQSQYPLSYHDSSNPSSTGRYGHVPHSSISSDKPIPVGENISPFSTTSDRARSDESQMPSLSAMTGALGATGSGGNTGSASAQGASELKPTTELGELPKPGDRPPRRAPVGLSLKPSTGNLGEEAGSSPTPPPPPSARPDAPGLAPPPPPRDDVGRMI